MASWRSWSILRPGAFHGGHLLTTQVDPLLGVALRSELQQQKNRVEYAWPFLCHRPCAQFYTGGGENDREREREGGVFLTLLLLQLNWGLEKSEAFNYTRYTSVQSGRFLCL